ESAYRWAGHLDHRAPRGTRASSVEWQNSHASTWFPPCSSALASRCPFPATTSSIWRARATAASPTPVGALCPESGASLIPGPPARPGAAFLGLLGAICQVAKNAPQGRCRCALMDQRSRRRPELARIDAVGVEGAHRVVRFLRRLALLYDSIEVADVSAAKSPVVSSVSV